LPVQVTSISGFLNDSTEHESGSTLAHIHTTQIAN